MGENDRNMQFKEFPSIRIALSVAPLHVEQKHISTYSTNGWGNEKTAMRRVKATNPSTECVRARVLASFWQTHRPWYI